MHLWNTRLLQCESTGAGNETAREWPVKGKYNEFPVIEAEDRYFTLEEAKEGRITEEALLRAGYRQDLKGIREGLTREFALL